MGHATDVQDAAGAVRLFLGTVFVVAAVAKLIDRPAFARSAAALGVPAPGPTVVPWLELALGVALAVQDLALIGALGAFMLLLAMTVLLQVNLRRGNAPECNCFGQLRPAPISGRSVARNVALAALAAFVVVVGPGRFVADAVGLVCIAGFATVLFATARR